MLAIFVMDSVASILLVLFCCSNPAQYAAKTLSDQCVGTTSGLNAANILQAVINPIADWLFATLPVIVIVIFKATTMNRREKFIVAGIFAFAITGSVAATLRPVFWPALTHGSDSGIRTGMTWCAIEIGAGFVASSAATIRPLFKQVHLSKAWRRKRTGTHDLGQGVAPIEPDIRQSDITIPAFTVTRTQKEWRDLEGYMEACEEASQTPAPATQGRCD